MRKAKRERLEKAGWSVGGAEDFLELSAQDVAFAELELALSRMLRARRTERGLSQTQLARHLGSSQSRVAKMEASDPSVSVDLLIRALLAMGAGPEDIAAAIAPRERSAA
jgi:hypothetical protein